ncbi:MAG TPA: hypothetical protein VI756_09465 [Blastocatellia bacterium]
MLAALFGQIKGVFGKSFLFAGLLPSALFFLGWLWFRQGSSGLEALFIALLKKPEQAASGLLFTITGSLALALFFFAARGLFLVLFETMPWRILTPLRYRLTRRQIKRRLRADQQLEQALFQYTVMRWNNDDFAEPKSVPDGTAFPAKAASLKLSRKAWQRLEKRTSSPISLGSRIAAWLVTGGFWGPRPIRPKLLLSYYDSRLLIKGLSCLYCVAKTEFNDPECQREIGDWKKLLKSERAAKWIEMICSALYQKTVTARQRSDALPEQTQWIRPTEIGNRLAALDDYAERRYNIDTSTLWTRLLGIISAEDRAGITDAQLSVEVMINLMVALAALGILTPVSLIFTRPNLTLDSWLVPLLRPALFTLVPLVLSAIAYKSAVYAVGVLSEKVVRLVDLNSFQLFARLGLKRPKSVGEELEMFGRLRAFFSEAAAVPSWWPLARPAEPDKKPANPVDK